MTQISIVGPDEGELALTGPVGLRILEDGSTTGHRLGLAEIVIAPRVSGPPQHRHAQHDEGFYVVRGTVRFTVGETTHDAPAGSLVMVPPGAPHTFANPGDETAVVLNTFTPDLHVQYFRDLRALAEKAGRPATGEETVEVMARYHTEPATTYAHEDPAPSTEPVIREVRIDDRLTVRVADRGAGAPVMLLHGGAGPSSVNGLAELLAARGRRVLTPTIPGFDGTTGAELIGDVPGIARVLRQMLGELGVHDVLVAGNSLGGWISAQMGVDEQTARDTGDPSAHRVRALALINAAGITAEDHPITDISGTPPEKLADFSFHSPDKFRMDPSKMSPEQLATARANAEALNLYGGDPYMHDPELRARLESVRIPVSVIWGESDRIFDVGYGRAYAAAFAGENDEGAKFHIVREAGHLPQIEQPQRTLDLVLGA